MSCEAKSSSGKIFLSGDPDHYMEFSCPHVRMSVALRSNSISQGKSNLDSSHDFCNSGLLLVARPVLKLEEVYRAYALEPVYYFSRRELLFDRAVDNGRYEVEASNREKPFLVQNSKSTHCPLKGYTAYFDARDNASRSVENVAWSYINVTNPDGRADVLKNLIAFHADLVDIQFLD